MTQEKRKIHAKFNGELWLDHESETKNMARKQVKLVVESKFDK